jgi:hypothetical protein
MAAVQLRQAEVLRPTPTKQLVAVRRPPAVLLQLVVHQLPVVLAMRLAAPKARGDPWRLVVRPRPAARSQPVVHRRLAVRPWAVVVLVFAQAALILHLT